MAPGKSHRGGDDLVGYLAVVACTPVGVAEIAQRLDVRGQTVAMWRYRRLMPKPEWTVSGQPCWNWTTIEEWARRTGRLAS